MILVIVRQVTQKLVNRDVLNSVPWQHAFGEGAGTTSLSHPHMLLHTVTRASSLVDISSFCRQAHLDYFFHRLSVCHTSCLSVCSFTLFCQSALAFDSCIALKTFYQKISFNVTGSPLIYKYLEFSAKILWFRCLLQLHRKTHQVLMNLNTVDVCQILIGQVNKKLVSCHSHLFTSHYTKHTVLWCFITYMLMCLLTFDTLCNFVTNTFGDIHLIGWLPFVQ